VPNRHNLERDPMTSNRIAAPDLRFRMILFEK